jgi:hypothetical protein
MNRVRLDSFSLLVTVDYLMRLHQLHTLFIANEKKRRLCRCQRRSPGKQSQPIPRAMYYSWGGIEQRLLLPLDRIAGESAGISWNVIWLQFQWHALLTCSRFLPPNHRYVVATTVADRAVPLSTLTPARELRMVSSITVRFRWSSKLASCQISLHHACFQASAAM